MRVVHKKPFGWQGFPAQKTVMGVLSAFLVTVCGALAHAVSPSPGEPSDRSYQMQTVATGLSYPWSLSFLPDGSLLVTELTGQLRIIRDGVLVPEPVEGVPPVFFAGQGGLFEAIPHPDFAENQWIYITYAHGDARANQIRVARGRFDGKALRDLEVIFAAHPLKDTPVHYGGRIAFTPDNRLLVPVGDGFNFREQAQRLDTHLGKIVRLEDDGSVPQDNPFVGQEGVLEHIWTYGHRNQQGLVVDAQTGLVYMHEHGPRGGDELNRLEKGKNYGWPVITWGVDYSGARISPYTEREGMEQPLVHWIPSIAPAGLTLYTGDLFPSWKGDLFVAALVPGDVRRIDMEDGKPVAQETLLTELQSRIRDIRTGPDGALYVVTDGEGGQVIRLTPAPLSAAP